MKRKIFFTSDWHIGHAKVIEYSNRPFRDCEHMHRVLINNYNASVGENDLCFFLGDMGFHKGDIVKKVISMLHGTKILILGNHDNKGHQFWYSSGFAAVQHSASIMVGKTPITMSHCPLPGIRREDTSVMRGGNPNENWHGESRHIAGGFTVPDNGQFHLHGHIHSPNGGKSVTKLDRQWDVGVDGNKYSPVSISQIESWIALYKKDQEKA